MAGTKPRPALTRLRRTMHPRKTTKTPSARLALSYTMNPEGQVARAAYAAMAARSACDSFSLSLVNPSTTVSATAGAASFCNVRAVWTALRIFASIEIVQLVHDSRAPRHPDPTPSGRLLHCHPRRGHRARGLARHAGAARACLSPGRVRSGGAGELGR